MAVKWLRARLERTPVGLTWGYDCYLCRPPVEWMDDAAAIEHVMQRHHNGERQTERLLIRALREARIRYGLPPVCQQGGTV